MYAAGPRVEQRFLKAVAKLDDRSVPMAETYRRARDLARQMGIPRPSYERIRLHLHAARKRDAQKQRTRDLIVHLAYNTRPADEVVPELLRLVE